MHATHVQFELNWGLFGMVAFVATEGSLLQEREVTYVAIRFASGSRFDLKKQLTQLRNAAGALARLTASR